MGLTAGDDRCPPASSLAAWAAGTLDPEVADALRRHVAQCAACAGGGRTPAARRASLLPWIVATVAVVAALAGMALWRSSAQADRARADAEAARAFLLDVWIPASAADGGVSPTVRRALDDLRGRPAVEAAARHAIGRELLARGDRADAREQLERAVERTAVPLPTPAGWYALGDLARLLTDLGQYREAERLATRGYESASAIDSAGAAQLGATLLTLGVALRAEGRFERAAHCLRRAVRMHQAAEPAVHAADVAFSQGLLAAVLVGAGEKQEAEGQFRNAVGGLRALGLRTPEAATVFGDYGDLLFDARRSEEALPLLEEALAISVEAWGEGHARTALHRRELGRARLRAGDRAGGLRLLREALVGLHRELGVQRPVVLTAMWLADALTEPDEQAEAEQVLRDAAAAGIAGIDADDPLTCMVRVRLGGVLQARGDHDGALQHLQPTTELVRGRFPWLVDTLVKGTVAQCRALLALGRADAAGREAQATRAALPAKVAPDDRRLHALDQVQAEIAAALGSGPAEGTDKIQPNR